MTFVVTGCAGFIGSTLVDKLTAIGQKVVGVDNFNDFYTPALKYANTKNFIIKDNFVLVNGTLQKAETLNTLLKHCVPQETVVIHLAGYPGVRPSFAFPDVYHENNVVATNRLLEFMRSHGFKKLVFASSSSVYGNNDVPFHEFDYTRPISVYGATKLCGEGLCNAYVHAYKMDITCLRFFTCYGPRQRPDLAIRKFAEAICSERAIVLYGDGTSTRRDYTYVDDIIEGVLRAAERLGGFNVINLGNSSPVNLQTLVEKLQRIIGKKAIVEYAPLPAGDVLQTYAEITQAQTTLGWEPKTSLDIGLANFVSWLKKEHHHDG